MHFLLVQILALHFLEFKFLISKLLKGKLISYLKLKQYLKTIGFEPITFSLKGRHSTNRVLFPYFYTMLLQPAQRIQPFVFPLKRGSRTAKNDRFLLMVKTRTEWGRPWRIK